MKRFRGLLMAIAALLIVGIFSVADTYEVQAAGNTLTVKNKTLSLGTTIKTLDKKLGKHAASYTEPTGIKAYVYNKTSGRFVIAYTKGSKVIGYFTLAKDYKTPYAKSGVKKATLKKNKFKADTWCGLKSEAGEVKNEYFGYERVGSQVTEEEYIDYWGSKKTFAAKVYLTKYSIYFSNWGAEKKYNSSIRTGTEKETLYVTNAFREYLGLKKLSASSKVANVARAHSKDMAAKNYFSHNSLDDKSPFDRIKNAGIIYSWAGENIAAGQNCGVNFVLAWIGSKGHRDNLKFKDYKYLGVGYAYSSNSTYGTYITQNFYSLR